MAVITLRAIICGIEAGTLWQDNQGLAHFRYDDAYHGVPLSLALPVSKRTYHLNVLRPFLFGLLPDDERQRIAIADEFDIRPNNAVAMLAHIGLDCQGGVQFCPLDRVAHTLTREGSHRPLDDHEIALRLKAIRDDEDATWMGGGESWSLGGNQGKFALAWHQGRWCSTQGATPTTHIFKNGVAGFRLQALNEYICMRTADRARIPVAHVEYRLFEDEPTLIVRRYDRAADSKGRIERLHQEDFCQALGKMPDEKHTQFGGPTARDMLGVLRGTRHPYLNMAFFTEMLFFNYLIGGTDAHAKNYSLLLGKGNDAAIAPLYDAASGLAYNRLRRRGRLAMSIGGENRFGRVGRGALARYAAMTRVGDLGLSDETCLKIMAELAESVPTCMEGAFDEAEAAKIKGAAELREHLLPYVAENCRRTLDLLD